MPGCSRNSPPTRRCIVTRAETIDWSEVVAQHQVSAIGSHNRYCFGEWMDSVGLVLRQSSSISVPSYQHRAYSESSMHHESDVGLSIDNDGAIMDREFKCLPVFYRAASRTGGTSTCGRNWQPVPIQSANRALSQTRPRRRLWQTGTPQSGGSDTMPTVAQTIDGSTTATRAVFPEIFLFAINISTFCNGNAMR